MSGREQTSKTRLQLFQAVASEACAPLLKQLQQLIIQGQLDPPSPSLLQKLRARWPADLLSVAIELTRARQKARAKFPDEITNRLLADLPGLEQASSHRVAEHKADRFKRIRPDRIIDFCSGIGGDAMALSSVASTLVIDADETRCWMAGENAQCDAQVADVERLALEEFTDAVFHIDPARRTSGTAAKRIRHLEQYQPGPTFLSRLIHALPEGAIKLGPGVDLDALHEFAPDLETEIEIINEKGRLVQAVLWCGRLAFAAGKRTATRIDEGEVLQYIGTPSPPPPAESDSFSEHLIIPDPAIERAGLVGDLCSQLQLVAPVPALGLLTASAPVASSWFTSFQILAQMPWRIGKIREWLHTNDGGIVEVKTRGRAVETDRVQQELRGKGETPYTVFGLRLNDRRIAIICRRCVS